MLKIFLKSHEIWGHCWYWWTSVCYTGSYHTALVVEFNFFSTKGPIQRDGGWSWLQIKYSSLYAVYLYLLSRVGWLHIKVVYRVNFVLKQKIIYVFVMNINVSRWKPSKYWNFLARFLADVMINISIIYMTVINRMLWMMVLPQTNDTHKLIGLIRKPLSRL